MQGRLDIDARAFPPVPIYLKYVLPVPASLLLRHRIIAHVT